MDTIGAKILEIRKRKGLTQEELSDLSKINLRTLQRIEKGDTEPHGNTLKNLCQVLEINIEDVLDYGKTDDLKFIKFFHLSVLTFIIIPVGNIILPLILWLTRRDKIVNLNEQGINLLNFQILWTLICNIFILFFFIFKIQHWPNSIFFLFITGILYLINIIYPITVSILISKGRLRNYYFPCIKFIKK
ncbi:MAG TPA: helix-turn-helix domain-containing protein [Ignavibacteria bacterium]